MCNFKRVYSIQRKSITENNYLNEFSASLDTKLDLMDKGLWITAKFFLARLENK